MLKVQWVGLCTITRKEVTRVFRIWPQTLLPSVITTVLYFLIFGNIIGERIGSFQNMSYIEFIIPGLIMMTIITNSYANVVSTFYGAKFQKNIEERMVSPLWYSTMMMGFLSGGVIRGTLVGILVTCVSLFFAPIAFYNWGVVIVTCLLTSILFALGGMLNAIFATKFDDIAIIPTFILTPLTYLGGVFYSIHLLPEVWQKISLLNPILYLVNTFRYGFLGVTDIPVGKALFILAILVILMWWIVYSLIKKGVGLRA